MIDVRDNLAARSIHLAALSRLSLYIEGGVGVSKSTPIFTSLLFQRVEALEVGRSQMNMRRGMQSDFRGLPDKLWASTKRAQLRPEARPALVHFLI